MIGTLILTHGGTAGELLAAARKIAGELEQFEALSLDWSDSPEAAEVKVRAAVGRLDSGEGVLILADTFGGTPCNLALACLQAGSVEVVAGVNLPMVMRMACRGNHRDAGLEETARWLQAKGRAAILIGSHLHDNGAAGRSDSGGPRDCD